MSSLNLGQALDLSEMVADAREFGDAEKAAQLPEPKGYRILCAVPDAADEHELESGLKLAKAAETKRIEENGTVVLFVLKMGDLCYKEEAKFPTGPWCKEGDFVLTRAYAGTRFKIHGREFRIINDDTVEGVVEDPRGYTRA
jgi:co-chaperonin GroES (HSP10)